MKIEIENKDGIALLDCYPSGTNIEQCINLLIKEKLNNNLTHIEGHEVVPFDKQDWWEFISGDELIYKVVKIHPLDYPSVEIDDKVGEWFIDDACPEYLLLKRSQENNNV